MDCQSELFCWISLQRLPGIGPKGFHKLLDYFGSAKSALNANSAQLRDLGIKAESIALLADLTRKQQSPLARQVNDDLQWLKTHSATVITYHDEDYPALLRETVNPPPLLYVLGDKGLLNSPQVAMVGARNASQGGCRTAKAFAQELCRNGITVTSGMALGIDAASHEGAIQAGGNTVAVLGTGVDIVYPARHCHLAELILENGALVSEFPLGCGPKRDHFPRRNRIISGLSMGVLVVEAARQSGSLITAQYALEQSREVFAIPGSIHNPMSRGCHSLIRQGAKLVESASDLFEEIGGLYQTFTETSSDDNRKRMSLSSQEERLLACIGYEPTTVEQIVNCSKLEVGVVSAGLISLELKGLVESGAGGYQALPRDEINLSLENVCV